MRIIALVAFGLLFLQEVQAADLEKGIEAYYKNDYKTAFRELEPLAEDGNPIAQFRLAYMYHDGNGMTRDRIKAHELWTECYTNLWVLADTEGGNAQFFLAEMYDYGLGIIEKDKERANDLYIRSSPVMHERAGMGDAETQFYLGLMYKQGKGVVRNFARAFHWYMESAKQGNSSAQNNLGWMYWQGEGVEQDLEEAIYWFLLSAKQGSLSAKDNLFSMSEYLFPILNKGDKQALLAYEKLGEIGDAKVLYNLAKIYDGSSKLVFPELEKAYMYAYLANYQGHPEAREELFNLKQSFMTDSMIDRAQELARNFYNKHGKNWF